MGKKGLSLLSKVFNHELFTVFVFYLDDVRRVEKTEAGKRERI